MTSESLSEPARRLSEQGFWDLVGRDETSRVEFKEQVPKASRLQEALVALANHRGGAIVVGVSGRRPHKLLGAEFSQDHVERVHEAARATQPPLAVEVERLDVDGSVVGWVSVSPLPTGWAQTSDGRLLVRAGPTNRALVGLDLLHFVQARAADPAEDRPVPQASLDDLDAPLLGRYLEARRGRAVPVSVRALEEIGLAAPGGSLRLATLLSFGRHPQALFRRLGIEVLRFEGAIGAQPQLRSRLDIEGHIPDLVGRADRRVYDEMRRDAVVRGLVREEVPEFPPVVVREALLNALAHRDYSIPGAAVQVRIYDDALEIESPGTLPAHVTVDNMRDAQYSRNERVMDVLQRLRLVEEAGQGIDRMYKEMEDALLAPPDFQERAHSFVVRLTGTSVFAAEDRLWIARLQNLGLTADAKIATVYARRHGSITNETLRGLRNLDRDASRALLQDLVARGVLELVGKGRGARYVLGPVAHEVPIHRSVGSELAVILHHARRNGSVVNEDVRGLLDVDRHVSRELLAELVARGHLIPYGNTRARYYVPSTTTPSTLLD